MAKLRESRPALGAVLQHGGPTLISPAKRVIAFPKGSFFGAQAQAADAREAVADAAATVLGGVFRFYGLAWGAPYFHFHMDEHLVFRDAYLLARDTRAAAMSGKFFMYSPGPSYLLNIVVRVYETFAHPLNLTLPRDEITYMVLGRAISATLGTATIPLVYIVARRASGRLAGVLAALLLACAVIHLRDSHFFALDVSMAFCTVAAVSLCDQPGSAL